MYFHSEISFVVCSGGYAHEQLCAPGTRNSGPRNFVPGQEYIYQDFCDVNLVNSGYQTQEQSKSVYWNSPSRDYV